MRPSIKMAKSQTIDKFPCSPRGPAMRPSAGGSKHLLQRLNADFLEEDHVVVAVILQAEPPFVRAGAAQRLKIKLAFRYGITLLVVGHLRSVQLDYRARPVQRDDH